MNDDMRKKNDTHVKLLNKFNELTKEVTLCHSFSLSLLLLHNLSHDHSLTSSSLSLISFCLHLVK